MKCAWICFAVAPYQKYLCKLINAGQAMESAPKKPKQISNWKSTEIVYNLCRDQNKQNVSVDVHKISKEITQYTDVYI